MATSGFNAPARNGKVRGCAGAHRCLVETITVAAQRIPETSSSEMALFIGIAFVVIAVAWMVLSGVKRNRQQQPRV